MMYREFVFLDEKGTDISGFAGPYNIGDKIINKNGEWVVEGLVNKIETNIFRPTFFERVFYNCSPTEKEEYTQKIILRRIKNGKEQK